MTETTYELVLGASVGIGAFLALFLGRLLWEKAVMTKCPFCGHRYSCIKIAWGKDCSGSYEAWQCRRCGYSWDTHSSTCRRVRVDPHQADDLDGETD